jgi:DNA-binding transcriptional LysR family regulator
VKLDNLRDLERFVAIGHAESLAGAGRVCGATPMQMSRCLKRLEGRLGTDLAVRTTRSCKLTVEGQRFLWRCERILANVAETEELVTGSATPAGTVRVSLPATFGYLHVAAMIPDFLFAYPNIDVRADYSDNPINLIEDEYDVAIRIAHLPDSTLVARRIGTDRRFVVAAPSYIERRSRPRQPMDLLDHDCLVLANPTPQDTWRFRDAEEQVHSVKVNARLQANSRHGLYPALVQGLGIGLFPYWEIQEEIRTGAVEVLLPDYATDEIGILVVIPRMAHLPTRVRLFSDFISNRLIQRLRQL